MTTTVTDVQHGLCTQGRVLRALILRETLTRYGQHKLGFLWALLEPILMVAVFVGIFALIRQSNPGGMPTELFLLTGIVPFSLFRNTMNQMQGAIEQNRTLLAFPKVTTFDVIISRGLLEVGVLIGVFALLLVAAHLLGFKVSVQRPLDLLGACALLALLGLGVGLLFASLSPLIPSIRQMTGAVLGRPLFMSSGIFFTAEAVPPFARELLLYNPLLHLLELIRSSFFVQFESQYGSWQYAVIWVLCALALGLLTHQALRKRAVVGL